jgi:DNA mismatch endonuclease (patch repair protein)
MSRVKGRDTLPEMLVRRLTFAMGYRYRLHDGRLPGKPDLVFAGRRKVIFVHGCFWHGHEGCRLARTPKSNVEFWERKVEANRRRDQLALNELRSMGWDAHTVWQCELKESERVANAIQSFLEAPNRR